MVVLLHCYTNYQVVLLIKPCFIFLSFLLNVCEALIDWNSVKIFLFFGSLLRFDSIRLINNYEYSGIMTAFI